MTDRSLQQYAELLRNDFVGFAQRAFPEVYPGEQFESNWHIEVLADKLEAVRHGRINRLIINVPPQNMKSFLGSTVFPAFLLGHNPSAKILCISYGEQIANTFSRECRSIMLSPFYQALFGTRLSDNRQAVEEFTTTAGGSRRAVPWNGAITGSGAHFIIIDDPTKAEDANSEQRRAATIDSFYKTVVSRISRESAAIILIMQRLHANDLTGALQKSGSWETIALPAIAEYDESYKVRNPFGGRTIRRPKGEALQPQRVSLDYLHRQRKSQGSRTFDAQYQQKPHGAEDAVVPREWLKYYDGDMQTAEFETRLQSWDTGSKSEEGNSYSVCTNWGVRGQQFYLLDVYRDRVQFRELKDAAISREQVFRPHAILIEMQSLGAPLYQALDELGLPVHAVDTGNASKANRLRAQSNVFESGKVVLPRQAHWLDAYIEELTNFPDSDYSDQVDSTSQALAWILSGGNVNFRNSMEAVGRLGGNATTQRKKKKLLVKVGGGTLQLSDGRPNVIIPETGAILEVDEDIAALLAQQWQKFDRIPD
jgi:predicted phage terminase large subunit-like protein